MVKTKGKQNEEIEKHPKLKKIRVDFYIFATSVFITFGTFVAMNSLQSSINIEDGLGNKTAMTTFASGILCAIFAAPILLRWMKPKFLLIFSDACFLVYVGMNAYPTLYTLIPGGVFAGIASATTWPCTSLFTVHFGLQHWIHSSKSSTDFFVQSYTAKFFGMFQLNQVFGNTFTAITFSSVTLKEEDGGSGEDTTALTSLDCSVCGANDCQDPNVTSQNLDRYNPPSDLSLYICIGLLSFFIVLSIIAKFIFLPSIPSTVEIPEKTTKNLDSVDGQSEITNEAFVPVDDCMPNGTNSDVNGTSHNKENAEESTIQFFKRTVKATMLLLISPQHLLIGALVFYDGMVMSFAASELTRAYASCVLGLPKVGAGMICYGVGDIIFSFLVAKTPTHGRFRNLPILVALAIDSLNYAFALIWEPNEEKSWVIYIFFFGFGCADGLWQTLTNFRYAEYFPDKQDIAFTLWNMWIMLGFFMQYALSSSMCVYQKIYLHLALLGAGVSFYAVAEYRYLKRTPKETIEIDVTTDREHRITKL